MAKRWRPDVESITDVKLAGVAAAQDAARQWEVDVLLRSIGWLTQIVAEAPDSIPFLGEMPIGGDGAPAVPEEAVAEYAAALGMSPYAARSYLADAWDLAHRLPHLQVAVALGRVPVWRARLVASRTHHLSAEATAFIDDEVAPYAHTLGSTRLAALVTEAEALFDPDAAAARTAAAAERRQVAFYPPVDPTGIVDLVATLDAGDADDLEAAIAMVSAELAQSPDTPDDPLPVRRAKALGVIARRQLSGWTGTADATTSRVLHTYVHLRPGHPLATIEKGQTLLPVAAVAEWCTKSGTNVVITPVVDLNTSAAHSGYVPPARMREQIILRDRTCTHPHCSRPARKADLDHIRRYEQGGPPGQTSTDNLAPLCRSHHRLKTHAGWHYQFLEPGYYLWRSPRRRRYLRTPNGTHALDNDQGDFLYGPAHQFSYPRSA